MSSALAHSVTATLQSPRPRYVERSYALRPALRPALRWNGGGGPHVCVCPHPCVLRVWSPFYCAAVSQLVPLRSHLPALSLACILPLVIFCLDHRVAAFGKGGGCRGRECGAKVRSIVCAVLL